MEKRYFPLFIDISEKKIVVIGGGKIAERRVEALLSFQGNVTVISPEITETLEKYVREDKIVWIQDCYQEEMLSGVDFVLAATNDAACNEQVVADCHSRGILVNASHKKEVCDFYFPGTVTDGEIVVGISSSGENHAKVKRVREAIENLIENLDENR